MSNVRASFLFAGLLLAASVASAQGVDSYRMQGIHDTRGPFTGSMTIEDTPSGIAVKERLEFAQGDLIRAGSGRRTGNRIVVDFVAPTRLGMANRIAVQPGHVVINGGRLTITLRGDTVETAFTGGGGSGQGIGRLLGWSSESDLPARTASILESFRQRGQHGTLKGKDGVNLSFVVFKEPNERGAVVFASGRGGYAAKYAELIEDMRGLGYSIYMLDHRGQGNSERILGNDDAPGSASYQRGYVANFNDYVVDLKLFVDRVVNRDPHRKLFGMGHSMGGAIVARFAEVHPNTFDAVVLTAPMIQIPINFRDRRLVDLAVFARKGTEYAKGKGPFDPSGWDFASERGTHSEARHNWKRDLLMSDDRLLLGGPTYNWVRQAYRAGNLTRVRGHQITAPVLMFQAGDEQVVGNGGMDDFAARVPNMTKVTVAGARHGILMESDGIRSGVLTRIVAFFDRYSIN